jgi:hypothetical protein
MAAGVNPALSPVHANPECDSKSVGLGGAAGGQVNKKDPADRLGEVSASGNSGFDQKR